MSNIQECQDRKRSDNIKKRENFISAIKNEHRRTIYRFYSVCLLKLLAFASKIYKDSYKNVGIKNIYIQKNFFKKVHKSNNYILKQVKKNCKNKINQKNQKLKKKIKNKVSKNYHEKTPLKTMTFSVLRLKDRLKQFLAVVFLVEKKNCRFTPSWHVGWYKYGITAIYNKIHKGIKSDKSFLVFKKKPTTLENFFSEAEWLLL